MVWLASHNYCKDSFKIEKILEKEDINTFKIGLKYT